MFFDCFGELRSIEVFNEKYIGSNVFNVVVFLGFGFFYYGFLIVNVYWNVEFWVVLVRVLLIFFVSCEFFVLLVILVMKIG